MVLGVPCGWCFVKERADVEEVQQHASGEVLVIILERQAEDCGVLAVVPPGCYRFSAL